MKIIYLFIRTLEFVWAGVIFLGISIMDDAYWHYAKEQFYPWPCCISTTVGLAEEIGWLLAFVGIFGIVSSFVLEIDWWGVRRKIENFSNHSNTE